MESFHDSTESKQILYISFNQDGSCFCLGTKTGFFIFNTSPLQELHKSGKTIINYNI
jgi:hypothetical protein